jgi:hypothetical protein
MMEDLRPVGFPTQDTMGQSIKEAGERPCCRVTRPRLPAWTALATAVTAAGAFAVAVTTPPRSGPYCPTGCIGYPYTDAAAFVPRDFWWMYPAVLLAVLVVVLVSCLHDWMPPHRRPLSRIGATFATLAAGVFDQQRHEGWSVVVHGQARAVEKADQLTQLWAVSGVPWAPGIRNLFIRIMPGQVSGRQVVARP